MCEYACFSCIFLSSFTHGMGIYLLLLSFNSVADLRCVIIDEAQPRGVLLRIKGTARRAVTWHAMLTCQSIVRNTKIFFTQDTVRARPEILFSLRTIRDQNLATRLTVNLPPNSPGWPSRLQSASAPARRARHVRRARRA